MTELVTRNYQWLEVTRDIGRHIEGCDLYQRMKNRVEASAGRLIANEVLEKPWIYLMVDFITKLPIVAGKDTILVVYDRLSKITHFMTITEGTLAEELVRLFRDNIWKLYSLSKIIIFNRELVICQVYLFGNYISTVILLINIQSKSLPSIVAIFLATHYAVVMQQSRDSIFYDRDTPI